VAANAAEIKVAALVALGCSGQNCCRPAGEQSGHGRKCRAVRPGKRVLLADMMRFIRLSPWIAFSLRAAQIGFAAQNVIALGLLHLAAGGHGVQRNGSHEH
jgi:hypothetical protein